MILPKGVYFVSGIDTDAGKSYATGLLARMILDEPVAEGDTPERVLRRVITQKLVQTGCPAGGESEDILVHRRLMGIPLQAVDVAGLTCTERFRFPASPHLAARQQGGTVDLRRATEATAALAERYEVVLVEGAGGLMVPLGDVGLDAELDVGLDFEPNFEFGFGLNFGRARYLTLDYVQQRRLPLLLVTSAKLGSLNHTLLSLEACRARGVEVAGVLWNGYPPGNATIAADTRDYIARYLQRYYPAARMIDIPLVPAP